MPSYARFPAKDAARLNRLQLFWQAVRSDAGLPDVRTHDLRHSFASIAARRSEPLPVIGKLLGHAAIGSTARYTHLDDETMIRSVERIGTSTAGKHQ